MTARKTGDNTAVIAAQFGISLKALRLYEQLGMLKPPRSEAGWRSYGPAEIERLHAILSFKQFGLPLARIAELFRTGSADMTQLLAVQEILLQENLKDTEHALRLTRIAQERLRGNGHITVEELASIIRKVSLVIRWSPELEQLAERIFTPDQLAKMQASDNDPATAARASAFWDEINAEIGALLPDGDPLCEDALAIGRRIVAFIRQFTRGDKEMWNNSARFWQAAVVDPHMSQQVPVAKSHFEFVGKVMTELQRRGELAP
jgi:MerR family transcriptional regulator, thiopeptide resistance regulator